MGKTVSVEVCTSLVHRVCGGLAGTTRLQGSGLAWHSQQARYCVCQLPHRDRRDL